MSEGMAEIAKHATTLHLVTTKTSHMWQQMHRSTAGVASNIKNMTESLLKWSAGIAGMGLGLVASGVYGMMRLGENVASGRTAAMGTGDSLGGMRAFDVNFGGLGNPAAFREAVFQAKSHNQLSRGLKLLNFTDHDLETMSTSDMAGGSRCTVGAQVG
jgi:hypothetical protein